MLIGFNKMCLNRSTVMKAIEEYVNGRLRVASDQISVTSIDFDSSSDLFTMAVTTPERKREK